MIRVLQMELTGQVGGIETFLYNVYSHIDRDRYHFDFVTEAEHPAYVKEFAELGAQIYRISSFRHPVQYRRDLQSVMRKGYDVIHINKNSAANIIPFILAKKYTDAMVVAHSHNTAPSTGKVSALLHYVNMNRLYDFSDIHLACSDEAGRWLYGDRDFRLIPNGIDVEKFRFDAAVREKYRKDLNLGDAFTLINVGRFSPQKNHDRLIDIFAEVLRRKPDTRLLLVGTGVLEESIKKKARRLSLTDNVIFMGEWSDVNNLLMASDCFVMPSLYEGLPISLVEAQAAGLSVFASDGISDEAAITSGFRQFSLKESNEHIAEQIALTPVRNEIQRKEDNDKVKQSDYNIKTTVMKLSRIYDISSNGDI